MKKHFGFKRLSALLLSLTLVFALLPLSAHAADVEVSTADALISAISSIGTSGNTILVTQDITLSSAITINSDLNVTIAASGGAVTITAANNARHIIIPDPNDNSAARNTVSITFANVTLQGPSSGSGGGIKIDNNAKADVTLTGANITGNTSQDGNGGGIHCGEGGNTLTLITSNVSYNTATSFGGGIYSGRYSTLTLQNSTVNNNSAVSNCGGIWLSNDSTATIENSEVNNNQTNSGGGIAGIGIMNNSTVTIKNSDVSHNSTDRLAGGIYVDANSKLELIDSTVKDNTVSSDTNALYIIKNADAVKLDGTYIPDSDITLPSDSEIGDVITRENTEKFSDTTLKSLTVNAGTLTPAFSATTMAYTVSIANGVSSITVTATANHSGATVTGAGNTSITAYETIIEITVAAEDGSATTNYTITVTRESGNSTIITTNTTPTPVAESAEDETEIIDEGPALAEFAQDHVAYIHGYPDGTVRPDGSLSRAQAAAILWRLLGDEEKNGATTAMFTDVADDAWYAREVSYLADIGIITGYGDGTFKPDKMITRAEFTVILSRFFDMNDAAPASGFDDAFGHWAESYINNAVAKDWIAGYPDGTFRPDAQITRAQAATMINKMLGFTLDAIPDDAPVFTDLDEDHWAYTDLMIATYEPAEDDAPEEENAEDEDAEPADDIEESDDTEDADDPDV